MSVDHYENFPVASLLCPAALRPAVVAIYGFARTADDLADEGDAPAPQRLADLADYRRDLRACAAGGEPSARWRTVFGPLAAAITRHALPQSELEALLDAFEHDVREPRHADRASLLAYCRQSANPVGRLLLHLHGVTDADSLRQSDAICTALQLINFWQDLSVDLPRGRVYLPQADLARHGLDLSELSRAAAAGASGAAAGSHSAGSHSANSQSAERAIAPLLAELTAWTDDLMHDGAPLVHRVPGRLGWELRLVVQGGLAILARTRALRGAALSTRPRLRAWHAPGLLARALVMARP